MSHVGTDFRFSVSALILAGGKATRFGGIAKHEVIVDGQTIFERQVGVLAPRVAEIIVATAANEKTTVVDRERDLTASRALLSRCRVVHDAHEGIGPLAGIAAGLAACRTEWLIVLAGDMPYITTTLIDQLLRAAHNDIDAVGIRIDALPEPLVCVLRTSVLPIVQRRIAERRFKASGLLTDEQLRVEWLEEVERGALRNINAPGDLRE